MSDVPAAPIEDVLVDVTEEPPFEGEAELAEWPDDVPYEIEMPPAS
jgi:hypothetical protein